MQRVSRIRVVFSIMVALSPLAACGKGSKSGDPSAAEAKAAEAKPAAVTPTAVKPAAPAPEPARVGTPGPIERIAASPLGPTTLALPAPAGGSPSQLATVIRTQGGKQEIALLAYAAGEPIAIATSAVGDASELALFPIAGGAVWVRSLVYEGGLTGEAWKVGWKDGKPALLDKAEISSDEGAKDLTAPAWLPAEARKSVLDRKHALAAASN